MDTYNKYSHMPYQDLSARSNIDRSEIDPQDRINVNTYQNTDLDNQELLLNKGSSLNKGFWLNNRFMAGIYYSIKNQSYEVYIMYFLIIIVLIVLIAMTIDSIYHYDHTLINLRRAELV